MVTAQDPVHSVVLPLPLQECWPYFREPALAREWHGWEYDGLAAEIQEIYVEDARLSEDHRTIALGSHLFNFSETDGATRVDVHRAPLPEDSEWREHLPDIDEGWTSFLEQLRFKLERHPADERRTAFCSGTPRDPTESPVQLLGLGRVAGQEVGSEYRAMVGPGDSLTGNLWFRTQNQVGVTVDTWGDGLLIVSVGHEGGPPYSSAQAMLTTYGLDEGAHRDLADRWREWWGGHY